MNTNFLSMLAMFCLALGLLGCGGDADSGDNRPKVVATTTMIADLARELGGDKVEVVSLMPPGKDPHTREPTPNDATHIASADLVLMNGVNLEANFTSIADSKAKGLVVKLAEQDGIDLIDGDLGGAAADPHCWMDVKLYRKYAEAARDALIEIDPANEAYYQQQAEAYLTELDELDAWVREQFVAIPKDQRVIATGHDAFHYYSRAYGVEVHSVIGISTEQEPKPRDIQNLESLVTDRGVKGLFLETSTSESLNNIIRGIAAKTGATVGGTLYSDSLGEPGGKAGTYIDMIRHNTNTIVQAIK